MSSSAAAASASHFKSESSTSIDCKREEKAKRISKYTQDCLQLWCQKRYLWNEVLGCWTDPKVYALDQNEEEIVDQLSTEIDVLKAKSEQPFNREIILHFYEVPLTKVKVLTLTLELTGEACLRKWCNENYDWNPQLKRWEQVLPKSLAEEDVDDLEAELENSIAQLKKGRNAPLDWGLHVEFDSTTEPRATILCITLEKLQNTPIEE